jgi:hypothetical protein
MNPILQVLDEDANKIINNLKTEINNFSSIKSDFEFSLCKMFG